MEITGGGRIDYVPEAASSTFDGASSVSKSVHVYGFSYRYGKGDHQRAAQLIRESLSGTPGGGDDDDNVEVTCDLSDDLY